MNSKANRFENSFENQTNIIINQTIENIFRNKKEVNTLVYNYFNYIDINYKDVRAQFLIDYPRIIFHYKKKKIPFSFIEVYLKSKKKTIKKKVMLFCSQILFAPILIEIHKVLNKMNENFLVAELPPDDTEKKHVVTQIDKGIVSTTKILRVVDIEHSNKLIYKFIIHFTASIKTSNILMIKIKFL